MAGSGTSRCPDTGLAAPFHQKRVHTMRVIIAGSRHITDPNVVTLAVEASGFRVTSVVSGCAPGVDWLGEQYANGNDLPIDPQPAHWGHGKTYDGAAGFKRNLRMTRVADALVAIWDGQSPGTRHMISVARTAGLKVYVERIGE